jgi:hypothetical protein
LVDLVEILRRPTRAGVRFRLSTVAAGRYRACRRDDDGFHEDSLTHQQAWAYAELMERRQPLRAGELEVLNSYGSPDKQVEAARRALDVKVSRYEWRSTKLLRGDDRRAVRGRPMGSTWGRRIGSTWGRRIGSSWGRRIGSCSQPC